MLKVCVPIVETTVEKARRSIEKVQRLADLIELRIDYLEKPEITPLLTKNTIPFIVTNRRKEEGGRFHGDEASRLRLLEEALDLGVDFIDVELSTRRSLLQRLFKKRKGTKLILSFHDFQGTPSRSKLESIRREMLEYGADVTKIVTLSHTYEDNLKTLSLIPRAREKGQPIVAFCMGKKGRMSRLFAPVMGAAWTYGCIERDRTSAPGQLTISEMKEIWEKMAHSAASKPRIVDQWGDNRTEPFRRRPYAQCAR